MYKSIKQKMASTFSSLKFKSSFLLFLTCCFFSSFLLLNSKVVDANQLNLSPEEKDFLSKIQTIRVHNEKNWAPYNFFELGKSRGYSIDYMNLIADKLNINIEYVTGPSWKEFIEMIKRKELDVMLNIVQSPTREKFLNFTNQYGELANAVFIREGMDPINSMKDLFGKRVAIPKGFFSEEQLRQYPEIKLVTVEDATATIQAVAFNDADALLDLMPVVQYYTRKLGINHIVLGGTLRLTEGDTLPLQIGIRKDWPILVSIFNKAMAAIDDDDLVRIQDKWITYKTPKSNVPLISLTKKEKQWLKDHTSIIVHNEISWPPFNYNIKGTPVGLSIDYMNILASRLGINVNYVSGEWGELLNMAFEKKIDVMLNIVKTPERQKRLLFTGSYLQNPNVIVAKETSEITDLKSLFGKKVSFPEGFFLRGTAEKQFPTDHSCTRK